MNLNHTIINNLQLTRAHTDLCIYVYEGSYRLHVVKVHVNNMLIMAPTNNNQGFIHLLQSHLTWKIIDDYKMQDWTPNSTLIDVNLKIVKEPSNTI